MCILNFQLQHQVFRKVVAMALVTFDYFIFCNFFIFYLIFSQAEEFLTEVATDIKAVAIHMEAAH